MAVESPPAFLQAGSYAAEQTRRMIASLLARGSSIGSIAGGLVNASDCQLSPPGSGMSVNVAPGEIWVPGSLSSTQSGYYCRVSSSTSLSIAAADPTNPRIDTVVAQVQDAAYSGSTNSFQVAVVTGTPTAGATLVNLSGKGAVPANSLVLGYVLVPANATSIVSADLATIAQVLAPNLGSLGPISGSTIRGAVNVSTAQSTSSTTYTTLSTPDQVTGIVMPTNGLIAVWYQASWAETVAAAARAAIFIGSNQLTVWNPDGGFSGPATQAAMLGSGSSLNKPLTTFAMGLMSSLNSNNDNGSPVTTGTAVGQFFYNSTGASQWQTELGGNVESPLQSPPVGGPCYISAAAGTYTISVQFKVSSGSVSVKNRQLWVQAIPFS